MSCFVSHNLEGCFSQHLSPISLLPLSRSGITILFYSLLHTHTYMSTHPHTTHVYGITNILQTIENSRLNGRLEWQTRDCVKCTWLYLYNMYTFRDRQTVNVEQWFVFLERTICPMTYNKLMKMCMILCTVRHIIIMSEGC